MKGCLIVNGFLQSEKFHELTVLFQKAAKKENIDLSVWKNTELLVDTEGIRWEEKPDFVIFWDKDILLAEYLENQGIPVYNSAKTIQVCDDKRKTHLALQKEKIPMPRTIFAPMTYENVGFTRIEFLERTKELGFPLIVKEAYGSFGAQVYLVNSESELREQIEKLFTTEILFQEYVEYSKGRDIRLQVVGDNVIGAIYRYSETDFRANLSAGGKMKNYEPTKEECNLALQAAKAVGADFAGVDLLFGKKGPMVCEVNSNAHFKNLLECTGVNTAEHIIKYIKEQHTK